jgi:transcriptional regulator with XRE-family HTH domain
MPTIPNAADGKHASLGGFIAAQREAAGLSQRQLAARAGFNHSFIARLESGDTRAGRTPEHLQRIADALELDVSELLKFLGVTPRLPEPRAYFRRKLGVNAREADVLARLIEDHQATQQTKRKEDKQ